MSISRTEVENQGGGQSPTPAAGRRRPRATLACINCRARKVKCDVQTSQTGVCTACRLAKARCVFNPSDDRRKPGARAHMASIQGRLTSIEMLMKRNTHQDESSSNADHSSVAEDHGRRNSTIAVAQRLLDSTQSGFMQNNSLDSSNIVSYPANSTSVSPHAQQTSFDTGAQSIVSFETQGSLGSGERMMQTQNLDLAAREPSAPLQEGLVHGWNLPSTESPGDEPVRRWGADHDDGPLRFYGPTTRPHSQLPGADSWISESEGELDTEIINNLDSPRIQDVLLTSFWSWVNLRLALNAVDEALFTRHRALGKPSQYYSNFLEDIIFACSSRMSFSTSIRKLGPRYAERAKRSLIQQLESPTIASLQGFLLLCDYEATMGRERIGWTYSGIASRLVFDLGLHEDCSDLVKQVRLTPEEARARQLLFFAAFQQDSLWSLYFGRPNTISVPIANAASYGSVACQDDSTSVSTLEAWIKYCTIVADVASVMNKPGQLDRNDLNRLSDLFGTTKSSYDSLLPEIRARDSQVTELDPSAYALNMQYCNLQITLLRIPVLLQLRKRTTDIDNCLQNMLLGFTRDEARKIKHENALKIARLAHTYIQIYGIERVHSTMLDNIFVAVTTLCTHILTTPAQQIPDTKDIQWVRVLSEAIKKAQKHFPVVLRMLRALSTTVANTNLSTIFTIGTGSNSRPDSGHAIPSLTPQMEHDHLDDFFMNDFLLEPPLLSGIDNDQNFNNLLWEMQQ